MRIPMRFAAAALLAAVAMTAGAVPAAADPPPRPGALRTQPAEQPAPPPGALRAAVTAPTGKANCAAVKADPARFLRKGQTQAGCGTALKATAAADPVSCQSKPAGAWYYGRTSVCLTGYNRGFQTVDATGKVTGTATVSISTDMVFQTERLTWDETWFLTLTAATGRLTTMNLTWASACGAGCTTRTTPAGAQTVTVGRTVTGTTTYTANPLGRGQWTQTYALTATNPAGDTLPVASYAGYHPFRCDRVIGPDPGCVVPAVTVTLVQTSAGADRAMQAAWYHQLHFPDGWGTTTLLHRQADTALAQANHDAICNGTDTPGDEDACVLFPPASTYETARLLGLSAADCADGTARQSRLGDWYLDHQTGTVDFTERCLRAHAGPDEATEFQRRLDGFYRGSRILDNDAFGMAFRTR